MVRREPDEEEPQTFAWPLLGALYGSLTVVFVASMLALILPGYRRPSLRAAEIGGWLIPAWLVMSAMVLGAIAFALHHAD